MRKVWLGVGLAFACVGCGESTRDPEQPPVIPLTPGTCVNTDCALPVVEAYQPAPVKVCSSAEGSPMIVEWSNPTSEVECAGVKCVVEPTDAAMGSGGETWTAAHLVRSSGTAYPIGLELRRNDANGAL